MSNRKIPALLDSGSIKTPAATTHSVTLSSDLLKAWTLQREAMRQIALAMPEVDFSFKPTPPQRSFGEQLLHAARVNVQLLQCLGAQAVPPAVPDAAERKLDAIRALDASYEYGAAAIA